ncbi:hypothetical protein BY996DRAFT_6424517 [Phakopsora pachyrhizi]|nr:hypothetical protein BY996DRAFT_6424517 [Phakopsora pachyrhizi]
MARGRGRSSNGQNLLSNRVLLMRMLMMMRQISPDEESNDVIMFQGDRCSVWQHGPCVGLYIEFPGDCFCEKCYSDLHTTGQYQKSSPAQRSKQSPSFTSSSTTRRERVTKDAALLEAFLTDAGVKPEDQLSLGHFALPIFAQTRHQSNMLVDNSLPGNRRQNNNSNSSSVTNNVCNGNEAGCSNSVAENQKTKQKRISVDLSEIIQVYASILFLTYSLDTGSE